MARAVRTQGYAHACVCDSFMTIIIELVRSLAMCD